MKIPGKPGRDFTQWRTQSTIRLKTRLFRVKKYILHLHNSDLLGHQGDTTILAEDSEKKLSIIVWRQRDRVVNASDWSYGCSGSRSALTTSGICSWSSWVQFLAGSWSCKWRTGCILPVGTIDPVASHLNYSLWIICMSGVPGKGMDSIFRIPYPKIHDSFFVGRNESLFLLLPEGRGEVGR